MHMQPQPGLLKTVAKWCGSNIAVVGEISATREIA